MTKKRKPAEPSGPIKETVGTIFEHYHSASPVVRYEYYVENKRYTGGMSYDGNVGWKYKVRYDSINPQNHGLYLRYPVFEEWEEVDSTIIRIKKVRMNFYKHKDVLVIDKAYFSVGGKGYPLGNWLYPKTQGYTEDELLDNYFKVIYLVQDPYRSIIILDKPIYWPHDFGPWVYK
jgi:hypothetical protein